jgi:aspartate/methionine/tyrosine aminotransferase
LPVNGSREALFAFAQTVVDAGAGNATVICPNPFYQIYEGAALLAGAKPYYAPGDPSRNFNINWDGIRDAVWAGTQLVYICSPGNPSGRSVAHGGLGKTFELSGRYGFVIASDGCTRGHPRRPSPGRSGSGRQSRSCRFQEPGRVYQLVEAEQRAGHAQWLCGR